MEPLTSLDGFDFNLRLTFVLNKSYYTVFLFRNKVVKKFIFLKKISFIGTYLKD